MASTPDKIMRIQADKLCEQLGYAPGTYIPRDILEKISKAQFKDELFINRKPVIVSPSMYAIAKLLLSKIT